MKFLIIGLGSMGNRRIRNLKYLGETDIIGFDISEKRRQKVNIITFKNINKAMKDKPDAIIISTPPNLHLEYVKLATKNNIPFFCELNLLSKDVKQIIKLKKFGVATTTMRHMESFKKIKELIDINKIGKITSFTYHVGQYLPDWHPNDNLEDYFISKKETSACKEIIAIELNWMTWMFGGVNKVASMKGKTLKLEINDTYQVLLNFKNKILGNMLVDVVSRVFYRQLKIIGTEGVILWDREDDWVKVYDAKIKKWSYFKTKSYNESQYIKEMKEFINSIKTNKPNFTFKQELENLKILDKIEKYEDNIIQELYPFIITVFSVLFLVILFVFFLFLDWFIGRCVYV